MLNSTSDPAKVAAANSLMDRGWGKAAQPITGEDEGPIQLTVTWQSKKS